MKRDLSHDDFYFLVVVLLLLFIFSTNANAQEVPTPIVEKVQVTVSAQMDAYEKDDISGAFETLASLLKERFESVNGFKKFLKEQTPTLYHHKAWHFTDVEEYQGVVIQRVNFADLVGRVHTAMFFLVEEGGEYKVVNCIVKRLSLEVIS